MIDFDPRLESEEKFHDLKYGEKSNGPRIYRFHPTYRIFRKMKEKLGDISGRHILEYGCGDGWVTVEIAAMGGVVHAIDISEVALERTRDFLRRKNLDDRCTLKKMSAENLEYPDNSFDIVVGFAILHHLELEKAFKELRRVMKPSGVSYFAEPLGSNPLINMYRKVTPGYRTRHERPLILEEIDCYAKLFSEYGHEEFYLFTLVPLMLAFLGLPEKNLTLFLLEKMMLIDERMFNIFPILRRYAWYSIFSFVK